MDPNNFQVFMEALLNRLEGQQNQLAQTNGLLLQLVDEVRHTRRDSQQFQQQQSLFNQHLLDWTDRQEAFNARQEAFNVRLEKSNERQDQFNIIFLDEIKDMKGSIRAAQQDIRALLDVTLKQHDERLKRPEDFMDGFMRKAG